MTNILISGANKGIGYGFVEKYLARPDTTVVATVRNPDSAEARSLHDIPKADNSKVILVKVDSSSDTDAVEAVKSLRAQGITHLDVVIANAGIFRAEAFAPVSDMKTSELLLHVNINAGGPVRLYQATLPLLQAAKQPKFIVNSSVAGSIGLMESIPFPITSYGASKAAINFLLRRIHLENPDVIAIAFHPGMVGTDAGIAATSIFGYEGGHTSVKDSVDGMVAKIDAATREESSGKFLAFDDTPLVW